MKKSFIFSFTCLVVINSSAQSQSDLSKKIDSLVAPRFSGNVPGISILVMQKGQTVYEKAFGSANLELNVPMTPQMVFDIGSITKQFTAVAILQLMEKGKLHLNDSLQKYIPDFPQKGYAITIENLLTHTSGLIDYTHMDFKEPFLERKDFTPKEVIDFFKNEPLEFEPGTQFKYSNSGYFLLGYIIEMISGESYGKYIRENILDPLSLTHTFYREPNAIIPGHVSGYKMETENYEESDFWSRTIPYAAGGLASNTEDLFKWNEALHSFKIIKKETLEKAFTPYVLKNGKTTDYGYGWIIYNTNGIKSIQHGGAITGFLTNEVYYPGEDIYVAVLGNCDCSPVNDLAINISGAILRKPVQPDLRIDNEILNMYIGTYTMASNPKRTIVISRGKDHLVADISGQNSFPLVFQSDKAFSLKGVLDLSCEFVIENNKVTGFVAHQNGDYVWKKTR